MVRKRADWRKKRKPEGESSEPDKKKSKTAIVNDDEKFELEDSAELGLPTYRSRIYQFLVSSKTW
jgi:hypothetical protein